MPVIDRSFGFGFGFGFGFDQTLEAYQHLDGAGHLGKVVVMF